jgi:hypothetical protein
MSTILTAQDVFNGPGFDADHILGKAKRELGRLRTARGFEEPYDHMFNFAVTLAAVCDLSRPFERSSALDWEEGAAFHELGASH